MAAEREHLKQAWHNTILSKELYTMSMQARYLMNNGAIAAYNYFDNSDAERAVSDYLINIISYFNYNDSQDEFEISDILN